MNKRNALIASLVALLIITAVPLAFAEPGRGHRMHGAGHGFPLLGRLEGIKDDLDLSDQQVEQLKAIAAELRQQNEPYRDQLRGGFREVAGMLISNPNDLAAAQAQLDAQAAVERTMKSNLLTAASKALNVLTPDQRAKLAERMAEHQARRRR